MVIIMISLRFITLLLLLMELNGNSNFYSQSYESAEEAGTLAGDVQNWAIMIQNYISQV